MTDEEIERLLAEIEAGRGSDPARERLADEIYRLRAALADTVSDNGPKNGD